MRIALLTRRFDPEGGGTERDAIITADCLRRGGHEVITYAEQARLPGREVRIIGGIPLPRVLSFIRFAFAAASMARREGAQLTLSFARVANADVLRSGGSAHISYLRAAKRWRGAMGAAAMRWSPYHRAQAIIERRGFGYSGLRAAIAVSEFVRKDLISQFGLSPTIVTTIYNGVDLERFCPTPDMNSRKQIRNRFGIPENAPMTLFVGNGFARKGLGFLIDALPQTQGDPYLLVVGSDRATSAYLRRAQARGVAGRVVFAGRQPGVENFFHAADVVALPSLFEPFGNVAAEAMASGVPALVSSMCGAAELMPPGLRELVVKDPANSAEVADKLSRMLREAAALRTLARSSIEQFTWARYEGELNQLMGSLR